mmetsp:Transcript_3171/g.8102  ORF Transcript_3171/g.8102 Transcript_3171/m.8102 type:complete len:100 (-) Transcript_3171:37-336(-)
MCLPRWKLLYEDVWDEVEGTRKPTESEAGKSSFDGWQSLLFGYSEALQMLATSNYFTVYDNLVYLLGTHIIRRSQPMTNRWMPFIKMIVLRKKKSSVCF